MSANHLKEPLFKYIKNDLPAGVVVFLVALPLCLGISMASGAPLFAGLISGIIGGIVVGALSGSPLGVSGPAAGLAVIVLDAIADIGSFEVFLVSVMLAGVLQLILGFVRGGFIAYYFPSSVIHGMLAGIGILIFLKQIPHAFGDDRASVGDFEFLQSDNENTFSEILSMYQYASPGVMIITGISLFILLIWESGFMKKFAFTKLVPPQLLVVLFGILLCLVFQGNETFDITGKLEDHLVSIPVTDSFDSFIGNFTLPNFAGFGNKQVWITAIIIAIVASLETLLCVEASDKQDPEKRMTPTNRELKAQGVGNILSGLIGGIPITQVIVRSSANMQAGGRSKLSTIFHGLLLLICVVSIPNILNLIPKAALAAILLVVGYKLAKPSTFRKMYRQGMNQFIPFIVTIIGMILTDLLIGVTLGLGVAIITILYNNFKTPYHLTKDKEGERERVHIYFPTDVTFLNKASVIKLFNDAKDGSILEIDCTDMHYIHHDITELIRDFRFNARARNIEFRLLGRKLKKLTADAPKS